MKRFIDVYGLDTHEKLTFSAATPYEAMQHLIYYLNLSHQDNDAKVQTTKSGLHLFVIHNQRTYSVINTIATDC